MDDFVGILKMWQKNDIDKILFKVWSNPKVEQYIVKLNTEGLPTSQLYQDGIDSLGASLGNYTPYSIEIKLGGDGDKRIDHITLKDTGGLYESFEVIPNKKGFSILANTITEDGNNLIDQNRFKNIIGLTKENEKLLIEFIEPFFDLETKKILSL